MADHIEGPSDLPVPLVYEGELIHERGEMLSLTDMWTAARAKHVEEGGDAADYENRRPSNWSRKEGAEFIAALQRTMNVSRGHIYQGERGAGGSTFAHWQVGLAYAKYLSPDFHMWCNTVVRARMEESAGLDPVPASVPLITSSVRSVVADFKALFSVGRLIGLDRNQSALAANRATRKVHSVDLLADMGTTHLAAPQQAAALTPTDIGAKLGMSAIAINKLLIEAGFQTEFRDGKNRPVKEPTDKGQPFAVWQDTDKRHSDGTPVRQLKWSGDIVDRLRPAAGEVAA